MKMTKEITKIARPVRPWSDQQKVVFEHIANYNGNLHVEAKAGSGKTATLVECTFLIPDSKKVLCCAFGKDIQLELEARVKPGVVTSTMHSIGFAAVRYAFKNVIVDNNKLYKHIDALLDGNVSEELFNELRSSLYKAVNFCKNNLVKNLDDVADVLDHYDLEFHESFSQEQIIDFIADLLASTKKQKNVIDYNDMIWFPVEYNMSLPTYDFVFVDEAQDLNKCQIQIALKSVKRNGGRIVSLGDTNQAIFAFAGADSNSIPNIVSTMKSKILPLSVCYRCPSSVIEFSQQFVSTIESAPGAIVGSVEELEKDLIVKTVNKGDVILSRTNAPIVSLCMKLLKNKIPANILGRDIASNIMSLVDKSKAKTIDELVVFINKWKNKECEKLIKAEKDCSSVIDKADCIIAIAEECDSIKDMESVIKKMFSDSSENSIVTLSNTHKYKGKQANNIFVLFDTFKPFRNQEETNLAYVATTRAIKKMYIVK